MPKRGSRFRLRDLSKVMRDSSLPVSSTRLLLLLFLSFLFFSQTAHGSRPLCTEFRTRNLLGIERNPHPAFPELPAVNKRPDNKHKLSSTQIVIFTSMPLILVAFCLYIYWNWRNFPSSASCDDKRVDDIMSAHEQLEWKRYRYSEVMHMTNCFSLKIGEGGYGTVYKGTLYNNTTVAVKILRETKTTMVEFINELTTIGTTKHTNVVSLLGFCLEETHRALVYEFMPNGSLEKFIYTDEPETIAVLTWEKRLKIALGIAKGLEYLHKGCNTRIVHFDIKPQNILLDENFSPKISDFGLSKLYKTKDSILSTIGARGTMGFIAPEVVCRNLGVTSSKSDVYSYGMMLLEMAGGRRNLETKKENESEVYFPHWIRENLEQGSGLGVRGVTPESEDIARKMILVGLWCIQTSPASRPTMNKVVDMLKGGVDSLELPPKPYICAHKISISGTDVDPFADSSHSGFAG